MGRCVRTGLLRKKLDRYEKLVKDRKSCLPYPSNPYGCDGSTVKGAPDLVLLNPSQIEKTKLPDYNEIGLISVVQKSLDAEIMVVLQDWGDISDYRKTIQEEGSEGFKGFGGPYRSRNSTLENLNECLAFVLDRNQNEGGHISLLDHSYPEIFLTNSMLCLKSWNRSEKNTDYYDGDWSSRCSAKFLPELIDIIQPSIIIAAGKHAFQSISRTVFKVEPPETLADAIINVEKWEKSLTTSLSGGKSCRMFPVYHPNDRCRANRSQYLKAVQIPKELIETNPPKDWIPIYRHIQNLREHGMWRH